MRLSYLTPLISILVSASMLFFPGFFLYFHQDDFMHMAVSQRWDQVVQAFNIFHHGEFPFYRPIPTQVYFYFFGLLFGDNPFAYHVINFIIFSMNTCLVYLFASFLLKKRDAANIAAGFYAINATHVAPLFSAAYVHELLYVFFALLTCITYIKGGRTSILLTRLFSLLFFILALMCKENAVILPGILFLVSLYEDKKNSLYQMIFSVVPYALLLVIYLIGHFLFYGTAVSSSYHFYVGKETITILIWYVLWAFSTPNILIDFVSGIHIRPIFFQVAGVQ